MRVCKGEGRGYRGGGGVCRLPLPNAHPCRLGEGGGEACENKRPTAPTARSGSVWWSRLRPRGAQSRRRPGHRADRREGQPPGSRSPGPLAARRGCTRGRARQLQGGPGLLLLGTGQGTRALRFLVLRGSRATATATAAASARFSLQTATNPPPAPSPRHRLPVLGTRQLPQRVFLLAPLRSTRMRVIGSSIGVRGVPTNESGESYFGGGA